MKWNISSLTTTRNSSGSVNLNNISGQKFACACNRCLIVSNLKSVSSFILGYLSYRFVLGDNVITDTISKNKLRNTWLFLKWIMRCLSFFKLILSILLKK